MTIRTIEAEVPDEFPPARLFLDDIEEIERVLIEAVENQQKIRYEQDLKTRVNKTRVTFRVKDQVCDEVPELPKISSKTINLSITVEIESRVPEATLRFDRFRTQLSLIGFGREQKLGTYHKLTPIFKRRNLRLATFIHSHEILAFMFGSLSVSGFLVSVTYILKKHPSPMIAFAVGLLSVAVLSIILWTFPRHSIIIMRPWSEPSAVRQGLRDKLPAALIGAALGSVVTFLLTLLGFYLKHKYWP